MHAQRGSLTGRIAEDRVKGQRPAGKQPGRLRNCHLQGQSNYPQQPTAVAENSVFAGGYPAVDAAPLKSKHINKVHRLLLRES